MVNRVAVFTAFLVMGVCCVVEASNLTSCEHGDLDANCTYTKQRTFDYMHFVQSWDGLFCDDGCCRLPATSSPVKLGFTVHGMWPEYNDGSFPSCCKSSFTSKLIDETLEKNSEIRTLLDQYWPALKRCHFVRYETEKHGSCAASVYGETESGLVNYWTAIVKLRAKWDFERALESAGIVPSKSTQYSLKTIRSVLKEQVGYNVNVACDSGNLLQEIRVCVKRPTDARTLVNPEPFDCPVAETSCREKVYLLPIPSIPSGGGCKVN